MGYDILRNKIDIEWCNPSVKNKFTEWVNKIMGAQVTNFILGQFKVVGKANKYDVIYFPMDSHILILAIFRWLRIVRTPIVMLCHSSYNMRYIPTKKKRFFKRLERFVLFKALDRIVFASPRLLKNAMKDSKVPTRHQCCTHWGSHYGLMNVEGQEIDRSKGEYYLSIGFSKRDYPTLLKAFVRMPDVKLKIVSPPQNLLNGTGLDKLPDNVEVVANPFDNSRWTRMKELYRKAKAALIPVSLTSDVPSGATFLVAAMASGLPLVVTEMGNNFIDVEANGLGLNVKYKYIDGWVNAIKRLENDGDLLNRMADNNTHLAKTQYNYEKFSDDIFEHLKAVAAMKRR